MMSVNTRVGASLGWLILALVPALLGLRTPTWPSQAAKPFVEQQRPFQADGKHPFAADDHVRGHLPIAVSVVATTVIAVSALDANSSVRSTPSTTMLRSVGHTTHPTDRGATFSSTAIGLALGYGHTGAVALADGSAIPAPNEPQRPIHMWHRMPPDQSSPLFDRHGLILAHLLDPAVVLRRPLRPIAVQHGGPDFDDDTASDEGSVVMSSKSVTSSDSMKAPLLASNVARGPFQRGSIAMLILGISLVTSGLLTAALWLRRIVRPPRQAGHNSAAGPPIVTLRELDDLTTRLRVITPDGQATEFPVKQGEAMLRDLLEMLDQAVIMTRDMDGRIRFWSQGCVRIFGWSPEEAVGRCSYTLLRTQFPGSMAEVEQALLDRGAWTGDLVHHRRDGVRLVVAADLVLRRRSDGVPDIVTESLVDVTALREAETKLRAINEDLEQRVQAEISARQAAQQRAAHNDRIQALGQLAGGIAHDFNNILQAIAGGAALIARHPRDAEMVSRFIAIISDAAGRGAAITRRILLLARRGDLKAEPIDIELLLAEVKDVFSFTLGTSIQVELNVPPGLRPVMADRMQLETALVNLATNARDAMPAGGLLRMTARNYPVASDEPARSGRLTLGDYVEISVADNGVGMDEATLARVGEPFFTTKGVGKGTGLGLSMVKGFAEQSGGELVIQSALGHGTTACIWLPVSHAAPNREGMLPCIAKRLVQILLVDDDPLVLGTVSDQLEDLGHQVLSASGGTDALDILRARQAIDLMITDLSMPGMNGLSLIQEAREVRPSLPAILLTGYANELGRLTSQGQATPAYTLINKPASTAVLRARITELLDQD